MLCLCVPQAAERPIPPQLFGAGEVVTPELQVGADEPAGMSWHIFSSAELNMDPSPYNAATCSWGCRHCGHPRQWKGLPRDLTLVCTQAQMLELHLQRKQLMVDTAQQLHKLQQQMHVLHSAAACDGSSQHGMSAWQV